MVKASDYVITGNSFLMEQAARFTDSVMVIPTPIDKTRYVLKDYAAQKDAISIGWIGDHGSIHYLERTRPVFEELGHIHRFDWKLSVTRFLTSSISR
jgi:hypothetical protein